MIPDRAVKALVVLSIAVTLGCSGAVTTATPPSYEQRHHTPSPAPGGYYGCVVFPPGDVYTAPVLTATADPQSAARIASVAQVDTAGLGVSTGAEYPNLANASTPTYPVDTSASPWHAYLFAANPPWPWQSSFRIEPYADAHAIVLRTSDCRLFETYLTAFSGSVFSANSGWSWDLTRPFVRPKDATGKASDSAMTSGLSLFAGGIKWEEVPQITHALNMAVTAGSLDASSTLCAFVSPASNCDFHPYLGTYTVKMPYGAHLRLRSTFDDSTMGPQARAIVAALKTYGAYIADTGGACCTPVLYGIEPAIGNSAWNASDLNGLSVIHITDFEVLTLPTLEHAPY